MEEITDEELVVYMAEMYLNGAKIPKLPPLEEVQIDKHTDVSHEEPNEDRR